VLHATRNLAGDKDKYQTRLQYQSAEITQVTPYLNDVMKKKGGGEHSNKQTFDFYDFTRKLQLQNDKRLNGPPSEDHVTHQQSR
jgi:hypothetical protein